MMDAASDGVQMRAVLGCLMLTACGGVYSIDVSTGIAPGNAGLDAFDLLCQDEYGEDTAALMGSAHERHRGRDWPMHGGARYQTARGALLATNRGFLAFPLAAPIGATAEPITVWTGLDANGDVAADCEGWSSAGAVGQYGRVNLTDIAAISESTYSCAASSHVYCVGTRPLY